MDQPVRTFTLAGLVMFFLLLMHLMPSISIDGTELRHVNILSQLFPDNQKSEGDVLPAPKAPKAMVAVTDHGKVISFKEKWPKGVEPIVDYSEGKPGGMTFFYAQLDRSKQLDRPVRIAYFGDSFIEGDILTGDLRAMLQNRFGGDGVGWIDCTMPSSTVRRTISQKSNGITAYTAIKKPFDKARQGISLRYFVGAEGATTSAHGSKAQPHVDHWTNATLFFCSPQAMRVSVQAGSLPSSDHLTAASNDVQMLKTKGKMSSVSYRFSEITPHTTLYGMALESDRGVILDNLSMRGASGVQLEAIPQKTLTGFAHLRPYDLIIVHFGLNEAVKGNTIPLLKGYMKRMKKAIEAFRSAFPEASILVVSVPDRDQRTADGITTLQEVKDLVSLQAQLAADCHVSFYNFYQAMGGQGSMKKLVDGNLANKDYTHLSFGGGKLVAKKMYSSFIAGFDNYKRRKALEQQ